MPLPPAEQQIVDARTAAIQTAIADLKDAPWTERARTADALLAAIHTDWWRRHREAPAAYAQDLARLNALAGWTGPYAALHQLVRGGRTWLTPPKFFGGKASGLHQDFVLAVTLNHATPENEDYLAELADFRDRVSCLSAHRDYFDQPYAYGRFFKARAKMLVAYATEKRLEVPAEWRAVNGLLSLYLERYPTISPRCRAAAAPHEQLEAEVFVMALNRLAYLVVSGLLRPRAVLLAGAATRALLPSHAPEEVGGLIRPTQAPTCPATLDRLALTRGAAPSTVLRCNFLRSIHGPNSDDELFAVGRLLAR